MSHYLTALRGLLFFPLLAIAAEPVSFSESSAELGIVFSNTDTQSVSWVDYNGDGWQDLFLAGHQMDSRFYRSKLFINNAGNGFHDIWPEIHSESFETDAHGSYWADYDNDGDPDLYVVAGGGVGKNDTGSPSILFANHQGKLQQRQNKLGLSRPLERGRLGLWQDHNGDGLLDFLVLNTPRPDGAASTTTLLQQSTTQFKTLAISPSALANRGSRQLLLSPLALPRTVAQQVHIGQEKNYQASNIWLSPNPRRVVQADLDGDGRLDHLVYAPTKLVESVCKVNGRDGSLLAYLGRDKAKEIRSFSFTASGPVKLNSRNLDQIAGWQGDSRAYKQFESQILSPADLRYRSHGDTVIDGIQISFDPTQKQWTIRARQTAELSNRLQFVLTPLSSGISITSTEANCEITTPFDPYLLSANSDNKQPLKIRQLEGPLYPQALVPGDFNNDGTIDLYASRGSPVADLEDVLLINNGNAEFTAQAVAAANQYTGPGLFFSEIIPGPHLAVADYNRDGALDLFMAGRHYYAWLDEPRLKAGIPHRLLSNQGNENNWLQIKLIGTDSNRDAIGAIVRIETAGKIQVRQQTGGTDSFDQHSKVLHFGLGKSHSIESIEITWPSGVTSELSQLEVNQIIAVPEPDIE